MNVFWFSFIALGLIMSILTICVVKGGSERDE